MMWCEGFLGVVGWNIIRKREPKIVEVRLCQDLEDKQAHSVVRSYSTTMTDEPIHSSALPQGSHKAGPTVPTCKFDVCT